MKKSKVLRPWWIGVMVCMPLLQTNAQCIHSTLYAADYRVGECHGLHFQQALGQVFISYGQCGDMYFTSPLTEQDDMTSVGTGLTKQQVRVYPNPVQDLMYIDGGHFTSGEVRVYSVLGSLLLRKNVKEYYESAIDLSFLQPGGYVVKIILDDQRQSIHTIFKTN